MMVSRGSDASEELSGAEVACPACGDMLAPWGYARRRSVQGHDGTIVLRARRARCRGCGITQVMLPEFCLPRRAATVQVVGEALLAKVRGASHRSIAADLGLPADTVRGWVRRATARANWLRGRGTVMAHQFDPMLGPILPTGTPLGDAMESLGAAAAAATRRLGLDLPSWERIAFFTHWQLLAPLRVAGST